MTRFPAKLLRLIHLDRAVNDMRLQYIILNGMGNGIDCKNVPLFPFLACLTAFTRTAPQTLSEMRQSLTNCPMCLSYVFHHACVHPVMLNYRHMHLLFYGVYQHASLLNGLESLQARGDALWRDRAGLHVCLVELQEWVPVEKKSRWFRRFHLEQLKPTESVVCNNYMHSVCTCTHSTDVLNRAAKPEL